MSQMISTVIYTKDLRLNYIKVSNCNTTAIKQKNMSNYNNFKEDAIYIKQTGIVDK